MLTHPLLPKLRELKLSGILATLPQRTQLAQEQSLSPTEFLALLLDDEIERRLQYRLTRRTREAGLDPSKTLARFDFSAAPQVSKSLIADLALCHFVERGDNLILAGQTGTGKSHLAQALALEALKHGFRALCRPTHSLLTSLHARRADGSFLRYRKYLTSVDLLVLDDFGLVPLPPQSVEDLYDLIRERYESKSIILTSNRAPEEWPEVFNNPLLASAALDRLTHHAHVILITGSSYRQKQRKDKSTTPSSPTSDQQGGVISQPQRRTKA